MFDLGIALKNLRESKNLSQKQVAKRCGFAVTTLSGYENNTRYPSTQNIHKLADIYGVTTDYLLGRDRTPMIKVAGLTHQQFNTVEFIVDQFKKYNNLNNGKRDI